MFRDKYRLDNEKIVPDRALIKYLSVRMAQTEAGVAIPSEKPHSRRWLRPVFAMAACFALLISVGGLYLNFNTSRDKPSITDKITEVKTGVTYSDLYELIKSMEPKKDLRDIFGGFINEKSTANNAEMAPGSAKDSSVDMESNQGDHSKTNTQVDGVDEADIVKTDGKYIYTLTKGNLAIIRVQGSQMLKVASVDCTKFADTDNESYPAEMYVIGDRLVIVKNVFDNADSNNGIAKSEMYVYDTMYRTGVTSTAVYDISDRSNPKLLGDPGQSGSYLSSRMVGKTLYLITNYTIYEKAKKNDPETYIPRLFDNGKARTIDTDDIIISIQPQQRQYVVVTAINVDEPNERISSKTVFGCGSTLYANTENMLIASSAQKSIKTDGTTVNKTTAGTVSEDNVGGQSKIAKPTNAPDYSSSETTRISDSTQTVTYTSVTNLMRFSLNDGQIEFAASGSVPGNLLNQFSMDEYMDVFRIVTTVNSYSETRRGNGANGTVTMLPGGGTTNALYTLNQRLEIIGRIENVAKDERVYSVRFTGDIGYFVTFRQVDPLFAVDLSDPAKPKILSALKIPGFSDYLHPYSDGLLFGFGHNANEQGGINGLKLSMFDVSDPTDVSEKHKLIISDAYWSEASYNHKAIVVSPTRGLIAFPCDSRYLIFEYSDDVGFIKVGEIYNDSGYNQRGLYIGNVFYVCSNDRISAYSMYGYIHLATIMI